MSLFITLCHISFHIKSQLYVPVSFFISNNWKAHSIIFFYILCRRLPFIHSLIHIVLDVNTRIIIVSKNDISCYLPSLSLKSFFKNQTLFLFIYFKIFYLFLFRRRGREGEREEKHQRVVASRTPPTGDLACNPRHVP